MWEIWKKEIYKIASRKVIWCGVLLLLSFITFRLYAEQKDYSVTIDGQSYHGKEAIEKDRKLTAEYAGMLTREKGRKSMINTDSIIMMIKQKAMQEISAANL
ncbi:hypothetical protein [Faecalicatena contorta]|uniref:hypothetical protein n=1 Tax=Faecalicatena contorta TaxID=39482 RepID=UPI001FAB4EB0|nr:hypothetical protein [Faecalicatena contorta]